MKSKNYKKIINKLSKNDRVLDIGGWEKPFNRANYVIDIMPYKTRKIKKSYPPNMREYFSKKTWIIHDIKHPLPFRDKEFDFVVCGHVLEDIKDPVFLCEELIRVSKAGYIEFPNRAYEMRTSVEAYPNSHQYVGYNHHKWFIEKRGNKLIFIPKRCMYSVMKILRCKKVKNKFVGLFWKNNFSYEELFFNSYDQIIKEALSFRSRNDNIPLKKLWRRYLLTKPFMKIRAKINCRISNLSIEE